MVDLDQRWIYFEEILLIVINTYTFSLSPVSVISGIIRECVLNRKRLCSQ